MQYPSKLAFALAAALGEKTETKELFGKAFSLSRKYPFSCSPLKTMGMTPIVFTWGTDHYGLFLFSTVQSSCHHLPPPQGGDVPVSWQCFPSFWEEQCLRCCPSNHRSQNRPFHSYLSDTCNYRAEVLMKRLKSSFNCALWVF